MKRSVLLVVGIGVAAAALVGYRFAKGKPVPQKSIEEIQKEEGVPVEALTARAGRFERWRRFSGELQGKEQAVLYANVPARVAKVAAVQGETVGRGRLIIRLDPLSATQSYTALSAARIQAEDAKRFFERLAPLYEAGAVAKEDFDRAKSAYDMARAALTDASGSMTLSSPIKGTLTDVRVREGDRVDPLQTLAVVADLSGAKFVMDVSQSDVEELRTGQTVAVCDEGVAVDDCRVRGTISRLSLSADASSRLFRVEAELPSMENPRLGTMRYARVLVYEKDSALAVPIESVIARDGRMSVFIVEDGVAKRRDVTVGKNDERRAEIVSGLAEGEQVVTWGANRIADGAKVKVVQASGEAAPVAGAEATPTTAAATATTATATAEAPAAN